MADGDDSDENEHNHNHNKDGPSELPGLENLQIDQPEEPDLVQEYTYLDGQLDQLGVCLDQMEARSDNLLSRVRSMIEAQAQEAEVKENHAKDSGGSPDEGGKDTTGTSAEQLKES
ncbi:hypothetical protein V1264_006136 [Littorina saxatilis]|uniref:Uncharacterized protein n=1 Tax=Littorina saxatilis TaxID=31220 RepID=A0AAN9AWM0_9CAEN